MKLKMVRKSEKKKKTHKIKQNKKMADLILSYKGRHSLGIKWRIAP